MTQVIDSSEDLDGLPSRLFSASQLAEQALQRIGAYSINDTQADPEEMKRTLQAMDNILAELAESEECFWLRPTTLSKALDANTAGYVLDQDFPNFPSLGVVYVHRAWLRDPNNKDTPLHLLRRTQYEAIESKSETGVPSAIYIDRLAQDKNISLHPVVAVTGYTLKLLVQTYNPSVMGRLNNDFPSGDAAHGLTRGMQRWLMLETAAEIGDGPVRTLEAGRIDRIRQSAAVARGRWMTGSNREKVGPRRTRPWGR